MSQRTSLASLLLLVPTLAAADSHVHATGRLVVFEDGQWQGMRSVKVQLKDSDVDTDDTLDTSYTDDNGYFTLDGYGGDSGSNAIKKPDIYVKFSMVHNGLADVTDEIGSTHTCHTATLEEFSGTHDFGTIHCTDPTVSRLWFRSMTERTFFKDETGDSFPDGEINVHYPNWVPGNYTFYETLHISSASSMFHELGHRVRHALDGDLIHWNWDNTSFVYASATHDDFTVASTQGFAFNEGYAKFHKTFFDSSLRDHYRSWSPISGGEYNEGNVAHDLVLLSERTCTDGSQVGFGRMYQTLKQNPGYIHSRHQFVEKFEALFPECPETGTAPSPIKWHFVDSIDKTLAEYLDWVDANSAATWQGHPPSWLPREAVHIYDLSENERHHWDTTARATFRAIAGEGTRYAEQWYAQGSLPEQERKMRERMVTTVAKQRIADLTNMRSVLARDIAATPAGPLKDFYVNLDARYARIVTSLQAALAAPTTGPFPDGIMPASFSSTVEIAR